MFELPGQTDVLIAGAGPSGLALATELMRLGVSPVVIDRQPAAANTSRAAVVHARTLEVLEASGATPGLLAEGVKVPIFRVRDRDETIITIDFKRVPSRYPFTLMCPQDRTERVLLGRLEDLGGSVVRPVTLQSFISNSDKVRITVVHSAGESEVTARWLVGCDGMHSVVREQSGIRFLGSEYQESFVLADVRMDWPLSREEVSLFFSPEGLVVVAPLPDDCFRVVATTEVAPETPNVEFVQSMLDGRGPRSAPARVRDVVWSSQFHIHHRVSESPRKGRVLLCGDAAHVHSPAGGQGMNTGVQDSVMLARVLAETLKDGREARLDEWARKRHEVAHGVVSLTDRITRLATMKSSVGRVFRNIGMKVVGTIPPVRNAIAFKLAELDRR
jgi:2-polyprenyl-6-methoxyphenol hydroxylase-like FAD-dependent oxidoreductase